MNYCRKPNKDNFEDDIKIQIIKLILFILH